MCSYPAPSLRISSPTIYLRKRNCGSVGVAVAISVAGVCTSEREAQTEVTDTALLNATATGRRRRLAARDGLLTL